MPTPGMASVAVTTAKRDGGRQSPVVASASSLVNGEVKASHFLTQESNLDRAEGSPPSEWPWRKFGLSHERMVVEFA
jgi:hypothetical protein